MKEVITFRLDKIDSLFPTPLVHFTLTDHLALNAPLVDEIAVRRAAEPGVSRTNRLGWHSETDLFERPEPAQAALAKALKAMTVEATARLAPNAVEDRLTMILEGWINVNPTGAYNSPHDHAGAFWSGVYYVAVPDSEGDSGVIEFLALHHRPEDQGADDHAQGQVPAVGGDAAAVPPRP